MATINEYSFFNVERGFFTAVSLINNGETCFIQTKTLDGAIKSCYEHFKADNFISLHIFDTVGEEVFQITDERDVFVLDDAISPALQQYFPKGVAKKQSWVTAERKIIAKADYSYLLNAVIKGCLPETQYKAVELLDKEIPPFVYKSSDPDYKFDVWLKKEINPVIVEEDGYKTEINLYWDGSISLDMVLDFAEEYEIEDIAWQIDFLKAKADNLKNYIAFCEKTKLNSGFGEEDLAGLQKVIAEWEKVLAQKAA